MSTSFSVNVAGQVEAPLTGTVLGNLLGAALAPAIAVGVARQRPRINQAFPPLGAEATRSLCWDRESSAGFRAHASEPLDLMAPTLCRDGKLSRLSHDSNWVSLP